MFETVVLPMPMEPVNPSVYIFFLLIVLRFLDEVALAVIRAKQVLGLMLIESFVMHRCETTHTTKLAQPQKNAQLLERCPYHMNIRSTAQVIYFFISTRLRCVALARPERAYN